MSPANREGVGQSGQSVGFDRGMGRVKRWLSGIVTPGLNWQAIQDDAYLGIHDMTVVGKALAQADGVIDDPTRCDCDPKALVGTKVGDDTFTEAEADVVRKIWEGPRGQDGTFLWHGLARGTDLFALAGTGGSPLTGKLFGIPLDWFRYSLVRGFERKEIFAAATNLRMNDTVPSSICTREWLEADGLGGFASGTSTGIRTRRYHALLLTATTPPTGRMVLVNGLDASVETARGIFSLSAQCYAPGVIGGDGAQRIEAFGWEPWPHWIYKLEDGTRIELEIFAVKGAPATCLSWQLLGPRQDVKLSVRPFLSGRDYHSLHKSNPALRFEAEVKPDRVAWRPYSGVPGVTALTNGSYTHEPHWYYNFLYEEEGARGLDCEEDLAAPGLLSWNLADGKAALVLTTKEHAAASLPAIVKPLELLNRLRDDEQKRREKFPSRLERAADSYIVERHALLPHRDPLSLGEGKGAACERTSTSKTIIAGYPWFTDWGRDTLIALRGLCLATGRLDVARDVLLAWSATVSEGMLPNRFPDRGAQPEFNAVDASLWFVIAVHEYLEGTVWPWLLGAFVDAWVWVHKRTPASLRQARRAYLQRLLDHLEVAGLGHVSEIADAEPPHTPRGCPWQAWSVGEALWLDRVVFVESAVGDSVPTPPARAYARSKPRARQFSRRPELQLKQHVLQEA
jgi:glycogen debranching enzyme